MVIPIDFTPGGAALDPAESELIRQRVDGLPRLCRSVKSCAVDLSPRHGRPGDRTRYQVHIEVTLPGIQIGVIEPSGADRYTVLSEAFDAVTRRLQEYVLHHPTQSASGEHP